MSKRKNCCWNLEEFSEAFICRGFGGLAYVFPFMHRKFLNRNRNSISHDWTVVAHFLFCEFLLSRVAGPAIQKNRIFSAPEKPTRHVVIFFICSLMNFFTSCLLCRILSASITATTYYPLIGTSFLSALISLIPGTGCHALLVSLWHGVHFWDSECLVCFLKSPLFLLLGKLNTCIGCEEENLMILWHSGFLSPHNCSR